MQSIIFEEWFEMIHLISRADEINANLLCDGN
jgi:hypothetical protein